MNKTLTIDALYDLFIFGRENRVHPKRFFKLIFTDDDFINLLQNKPHDIIRLEGIIASLEKSNFQLSDNQLRYLSYLIVTFIHSTNIPLNKIHQYLNADDILDNFNYYHLKDEQEVIFELMTRHNEKYIINGLNLYIDEFIEALKYNLSTLYPFKRFEDFELIIDHRSPSIILYIKEGEVLFYTDNIKDIVRDNYMLNRYLLGNACYIFSNETIDIDVINPPFTLYYFEMHEKEIRLYEPGGQKHLFKLK